jgi:phosphopantetheinyl transferase
LSYWLSADEIPRARSYRRPADQWRFLVGRALLRHALQNAHGIERAALHILFDGKPVLKGDLSAKVDVSITHDGTGVAVAISTEGQIGLDLTEFNRFKDWQDFATDYMHPIEYQCAQNLSPETASLTACRIWTAKEAVLKASGHGLTVDPRELCIKLGHHPSLEIVPPSLPSLSRYKITEHDHPKDGQLTTALLARGPGPVRHTSTPRFHSIPLEGLIHLM